MEIYRTVDTLLCQAVDKEIFPGAVAAVGRGEDVFFKKAYGRLSLPKGPAVNLKTRYDMASLSKVMATTMVALLAMEEGRLSLSDPISRFFDTGDMREDITIFHLMTHTSGLTGSHYLGELIDHPEKACRTIARLPSVLPVGSDTVYSCMGYIMLGCILERVYDRPLNMLAEEMVFAPLGMTNTTYNPQGRNIAATELDTDTGYAITGVVHDENARFMGGVSGNAGVFSDIGDCIKFVTMLATGGAHKKKAFLSPAAMALAIMNHTPGKSQRRGLGFKLAGGHNDFIGDLFPKESFGHTGFTGTSMVVDPTTGLYAILLSNRVHPSRLNEMIVSFRRHFHNAVYAAFSREGSVA